MQRGPHPEESREPAGRLRRGSILVPVKARNVPDAIEGSSRGQRPGEAAEGLRAGGGRVHDHEPRPGGDAERRFGPRVEPEVGEHAFRRAPVSGQHHAHRVGARASHRATDGPSRGGGFPVRPRRGRGSGPRQRQSPAQHVQPRPALSPRPAARVPGHGVGAGFRLRRQRQVGAPAGERPTLAPCPVSPSGPDPGRPRCGRRRRASPRARRGRPLREPREDVTRDRWPDGPRDERIEHPAPWREAFTRSQSHPSTDAWNESGASCDPR